MTKYNTLNVKLSNSKLNKLKWAIKNGTEANLNLSSTVVGDSNDRTNFSQKSSLTDKLINWTVLRFCKAFTIVSSANTKFSKAERWYGKEDFLYLIHLIYLVYLHQLKW